MNTSDEIANGIIKAVAWIAGAFAVFFMFSRHPTASLLVALLLGVGYSFVKLPNIIRAVVAGAIAYFCFVTGDKRRRLQRVPGGYRLGICRYMRQFVQKKSGGRGTTSNPQSRHTAKCGCICYRPSCYYTVKCWVSSAGPPPRRRLPSPWAQGTRYTTVLTRLAADRRAKRKSTKLSQRSLLQAPRRLGYGQRPLPKLTVMTTARAPYTSRPERLH